MGRPLSWLDWWSQPAAPTLSVHSQILAWVFLPDSRNAGPTNMGGGPPSMEPVGVHSPTVHSATSGRLSTVVTKRKFLSSIVEFRVRP